VLDGRLDDAAWRSAELAADFVQQRPTPGAPASERTEARVLFDAGALYVSLRMFDNHPDSLLAPLGRRDAGAYGDWAHVIIDSYHDRRTGFHFAVNPAGTRLDGMISNDAEWQEDTSWDAVWDVATARDSLGWTAEFRIPLTQLRFDRCGDASQPAPTLAKPNDGAAAAAPSCAWGIQFMRDLARRNERSTWAPIVPGAAGYVSRFGTLAGIDGVRSPRRIDLVPYTLAEATRSPADPTNPFDRRTTVNGAFGADIGLGITSKLTLNATINPDFGQVEADPSEVNLTGAETFLRERRPFFVEGGDIFRYVLGDDLLGQEQLFYSRRIGRTPQLDDPASAIAVDRPDVTRILGAAKLSGKAGPWTLGILDAMTGTERAQFVNDDGIRGSAIVEPRTNYAFARLSRDGADGRNSAGIVASAVHRDLDPAAALTLRSTALMAGIDGRLRSRDRSYTVIANMLASHVSGTPQAITETQRSSVHLMQRPDRRGGPLDTTRTSLAGMSAEVRAMKQGGGPWRWGINGRVATSGFEINDIGYQLRSDVVTATSWVGYTHFAPGRVLRRWETWFNQMARWTFDGDRERLAANVYGQASFQNNWTLMGELRREFSQQSPTFLRGGPATYVPPNVSWWGRLVFDPRRVLSGELVTQGSVDDVDGGSRVTFSPIVTLRPASRAEVSLQPSITRVTNPSQYVETASADGRYQLRDRAAGADHDRTNRTPEPHVHADAVTPAVRAAIPERGEVRPSGRSPSPGRSGAGAARLHVRRERGLAGRRERAAHRPRPGAGADHTGRPEFHGGRAPVERRATLGVSPGFGAVLRLGAVAERRRECSRSLTGQPGARPVAYARHERAAGQVQLLAGAVKNRPRTLEAISLRTQRSWLLGATHSAAR
jgi:hypothetical protein